MKTTVLPPFQVLFCIHGSAVDGVSRLLRVPGQDTQRSARAPPVQTELHLARGGSPDPPGWGGGEPVWS